MSTGEVRHQYLAAVTRKLVLFTASSLLAIGAAAYVAQWLTQDRSFLVLMVFAAGLIGGFVSVQQRLPHASTAGLRRLSQSWSAILLIPINGGIFAVVLHTAFLGKVVEGSLFPSYLEFNLDPNQTGAQNVVAWLRDVAPQSPIDLGKLLFWSFVAGFSERLVPQILHAKADVPLGRREAAPEPAEGSDAPSGQGQR